MRTGEPARGRDLMLQALATFELLSDVLEAARCYLYLARNERDAGDREQAIVHYREALQRYQQIGHPSAEEARRRLRELGVGE